MNGADALTLVGWHEQVAQAEANGLSALVPTVTAISLVERVAAEIVALSKPVGVDYCLTHCGVRNEDEEACDFSRHERGLADPQPCDFRPLVYVVQT